MKAQIFAALLLLLSIPAFAQLSPGKLHQSHADLEGLENCSNCHQFKRKISADNCLDCHTILNNRIASGKGLHANNEYNECEKCHIEHQGRDYDLVYWPDGKDNFKHELTGYHLEDKHSQLNCSQCHQSKNITNKALFLEKNKDLNKTLLGLDQDCLSCHMDEHRSQFTQECTNCHTMEGWKPANKFNHQNTNFILTGKHQQVDCGKCHPQVTDNKYNNHPSFSKYTHLEYQNCVNCHQDVHNNKFGPNCESCHNTAGWKTVNRNQFDHNRTSFPLKGKHITTACEQCHLPGMPIKINQYDRCVDCHTDYHKNQFTKIEHIGNCEQCHTEQGFTPALFTIEKHNSLNFHLEGSHKAVPCIACHKKTNTGTDYETIQFYYPDKKCSSCHKDPHNGQVNKFTTKQGCEACHSVASWYTINFDHNQTKFALEGRHKNVSCVQCHVEEDLSNYKTYAFVNLASDCQSCHNDVHLGQFREDRLVDGKNHTNCDRCHTPANWIAEKFEHNRDASFKLDGAHQSVPCNDCHKELSLKGNNFRLYKPLRSDCKFCHTPSKKVNDNGSN